MVARLLRCSVSFAQKPKSARLTLDSYSFKNTSSVLTDLDISPAVQQDIVALDIAMDDVLLVQMF